MSELGFETLEAGKSEISKLDHLIPKDAGQGSGVLGLSPPGSAEAPLRTGSQGQSGFSSL